MYVVKRNTKHNNLKPAVGYLRQAGRNSKKDDRFKTIVDSWFQGLHHPVDAVPRLFGETLYLLDRIFCIPGEHSSQ